MENFLNFENCGKVVFADIPTTGKENARKSSNLSYHISLPDKIRIIMREISKRNPDGQIEIQEMLKYAQTELKQAQITAVGTMNDSMKILTKRPKANLDNLEISQARGNHQFSNTRRSGEMTLVQVETAAFLPAPVPQVQVV